MTELAPNVTVVDADDDATAATYRDPDAVEIRTLSPVERAYLSPAEIRAGRASRSRLAERIRSTEGEALAAHRRSGEPIAVRAAPDRHGIVRTEATGQIDVEVR